MTSMKVILTGATGMVGEGVLLECLDNPKVDRVLSVSRRSCGRTHAKLTSRLRQASPTWLGNTVLGERGGAWYEAGMGNLISRDQLRKVIFEILSTWPYGKQSRTVLAEVGNRLREIRADVSDQDVLTVWHDLFRSGVFAWGYDLFNPDPPHFHITEHGRKTLEHLSRDPMNAEGYLASIDPFMPPGSVARSYLEEAVETYRTGCYKATAVMTGAAAESLLFDLRDVLVAKMKALNVPVPQKLNAWMIKTVRSEIKALLDPRKGTMDKPLKERYEAYWPLSEQIRISRNDAGHPTMVDPVTEGVIHANLLMLPELARLLRDLSAWVTTSYV